jgi:hypothetical protein
MNKNEAAAWLAQLQEMPVYSTHEHHREYTYQSQLDLETLFQWSYVGWCAAPPSSPKERGPWLDAIRTNTYFLWLERGLQRIYGIDAVEADGWDALSARIREAHRQPHWHIDIMKTYGGYEGFMEDSYWDSGSDVGYPEFVTPVYRLDMWMQGYHPESLTNEGTSVHTTFGPFRSFDDYLDRLEYELASRRDRIAALKCASAYQRSIAFGRPSREEAERIYGRHPSECTETERNLFGDYILHRVLEIAGRLELPLQIHTGLARLSGSNPLLLEPILQAYPNNRFVLFHGGFPWIYDTAALAHNYANVWIDINWLPLISTSAAMDALHVYIDVLRDATRIAWGGDTWTGEEAVGASMAFRHTLANVLATKVSRDGWRARDAERFAAGIMSGNARSLYRV